MLAGLLAAGWGAGSGHAASTAARDRAGDSTVTISLSADPPTLDPAFSSSLYDRQVLNSLCDKLFDLNSKGKIIPMLATSYKASKNHLVYTITLRKGVKFTDGTSLDASAVVYNLDRDRDPASIRANELQYVTSVKTSGKYGVVIKLSQPFSPFISVLTDRSGMIVSPTQAKKEGQNFKNAPVCSGPFTLSDRVKGDHITLVRNPHYWRKGYPKAAKIVWKIFTDPNIALVNLRSGQVDMTDALPPQQVTSLQHDSQFKIYNKAGYGYQGIWINVNSAPFNNRALRQAMSLLIDRNTLAKVLLNNTVRAGDSPFGPGDFAHDSSDKAPARNVRLAKSILAKAKLKNISFTFKTATGTLSGQIAQFIQSQLQAGGITMTIQQEDFGSLLDQLTKHNFQVGALGWSGRPDPDQNVYDFFITNGKNNSAGYSSSYVDHQLNVGRKELTQAKRKAAYDLVMKRLHLDQPYVFLYHPNNLIGQTTHVSGFTYVPDGIIRTAGLSKK